MINSAIPKRDRLPKWLSQKIPFGSNFFRVTRTLAQDKIHTVCEEAKCPNRVDCWSRGTLTFQISGNICTRACRFCAETRGKPMPLDPNEPKRILQAAKKLHLRHIVITAPARDDLLDGGAEQFAVTIKTLRKGLPQATIEVLVPDFQENPSSLQLIFDAKPHVFNHNLETVRRLTPRVRSRAKYDRTLRVLSLAKKANLKTKSGLMVGLGESIDELYSSFQDLHQAQVNYLTMGQYLPPTPQHLPLIRYYSPHEFDELKMMALQLGFEKVFSGPLVRSSFHAEDMI